MVHASLRLAPQAAARVKSAIVAWVLPSSATESGVGASADASRSPRVAEWPSISQQRADGLVELLRSGDQGGGAIIETEVVLHVRGDGCTFDDGTPITGSIVEKIAPSAFLRALIHDADRTPINASGRQRHPTARQQRVVHERDRGCVDCGSSSVLQFDHDPAFSVSGHTVVDELFERCWTCHRARHATEAESEVATQSEAATQSRAPTRR